jgi:hypothetical protein
MFVVTRNQNWLIFGRRKSNSSFSSQAYCRIYAPSTMWFSRHFSLVIWRLILPINAR